MIAISPTALIVQACNITGLIIAKNISYLQEKYLKIATCNFKFDQISQSKFPFDNFILMYNSLRFSLT